MNFTKGLGLRTIKTGIAVALCILIANLTKMTFPFYAAIAAAICMQSTVFDTMTTGIHRMYGTFIGAIVGLAFVYIAPMNFLLCGIGVIIVVYLCNLLKITKSVTIGCIVFIAIMTQTGEITTQTGESNYHVLYGIYRLTDTLIGIVIAVLVNYILLPPVYFDEIHKSANSIVDNLFVIFGNYFINNTYSELGEINKKINSLEKLLNLYKKEFKRIGSKRVNVEKLIELLENSKEVYNHFGILYKMNCSGSLTTENFDRIKEIYNTSFKTSSSEETKETIVLNYHVEKLLDFLSYYQKIDLSKNGLEEK